MPLKFNQEHKEVREFKEQLPFGISKVQLVTAVQGQTDKGQEYIEVTITNEAGLEDSVRLWFTTDKAANISFNTLRQIAVHNAKTEEAKAKARDVIDAVDDTKELADLITKNVMGGELWYTKYYDPERTYTDQQGDLRRSVNKNVLGYEPKLKPELMPAPNTGPADVDGMLTTPTTPTSATGEAVPFASKSDGSIPADDAWSK